MQIPAGDSRRHLVELANPISAEQPAMRTTLLAPLLATMKRNLGRGQSNVALFEVGMVVLSDGQTPAAPQLGTSARPTDAEIEGLNAAVPVQPTYVGALVTGVVERGSAEIAATATWTWQRTLGVISEVLRDLGAHADFVSAEQLPWHPGRCAAIVVGEQILGFAGELHPRVIESYGLPARTCAFEFDLSALAVMVEGVKVAEPVRTFPRASVDIALVLDAAIQAESVRRVIRDSAGELLESVRLFDIYEGSQVDAGKKSLAFALEFRAPDRTLTDAEVLSVRDTVVSACEQQFGARLR
jgi:phenylalanyl-tRNA synthetase beta chain